MKQALLKCHVHSYWCLAEIKIKVDERYYYYLAFNSFGAQLEIFRVSIYVYRMNIEYTFYVYSGLGV